MRNSLAALAALTGALACAVPAHAAGANVGFAGTSTTHDIVDGTSFTGSCHYAREAIGLGGSGITYHIAGAGSAGGAYKGIPVVATGIRCRLILPTEIVVSGPEYLPGAAAVTNTDHVSNDASGGLICTTIFAVLRQTPPGEADNLVSTREDCQ
jgi:hypothetical protein